MNIIESKIETLMRENKARVEAELVKRMVRIHAQNEAKRATTGMQLTLISDLLGLAEIATPKDGNLVIEYKEFEIVVKIERLDKRNRQVWIALAIHAEVSDLVVKQHEHVLPLIELPLLPQFTYSNNAVNLDNETECANIRAAFHKSLYNIFVDLKEQSDYLRDLIALFERERSAGGYMDLYALTYKEAMREAGFPVSKDETE